MYEVPDFPSSKTMWTYTPLVLRIYALKNNKNFNAISEIFFCHILEKLLQSFLSFDMINDQAFPYAFRCSFVMKQQLPPTLQYTASISGYPP
jgi:hypothetical protein